MHSDVSCKLCDVNFLSTTLPACSLYSFHFAPSSQGSPGRDLRTRRWQHQGLPSFASPSKISAGRRCPWQLQLILDAVPHAAPPPSGIQRLPSATLQGPDGDKPVGSAQVLSVAPLGGIAESHFIADWPVTVDKSLVLSDLQYPHLSSWANTATTAGLPGSMHVFCCYHCLKDVSSFPSAKCQC